jgi:pimeloyl-ACP methyl ester carboxylesterase
MRAASVLAPSTVERMLIARFCTPSHRDVGPNRDMGEQWTIRSGREDIEIYSDGTGPRVLFVHGWEGAARDFEVMAAAFRRAGYGTVAFDHPAHGHSTGRSTTLPALSRAILDVARATGPFDAVIAHSLGASATLLALRDGLPARCAILVAPPYDARPFIRELGTYIGVTDARIRGAIARLERTVDVVGGRELDRFAAHVATPGLVLHDRFDRAVPFTHGVAVAAAWPRSSFVALEGLGHRRVLDAPDVHDRILTFIRPSTDRQPKSLPDTTPRVAAAETKAP